MRTGRFVAPSARCCRPGTRLVVTLSASMMTMGSQTSRLLGWNAVTRRPSVQSATVCRQEHQAARAGSGARALAILPSGSRAAGKRRLSSSTSRPSFTKKDRTSSTGPMKREPEFLHANRRPLRQPGSQT